MASIFPSKVFQPEKLSPIYTQKLSSRLSYTDLGQEYDMDLMFTIQKLFILVAIMYYNSLEGRHRRLGHAISPYCREYLVQSSSFLSSNSAFSPRRKLVRDGIHHDWIPLMWTGQSVIQSMSYSLEITLLSIVFAHYWANDTTITIHS